MPLKQVIEKYIKDDDLKTFALASAYIGNDEGHYYRNNPDKDFLISKLPSRSYSLHGNETQFS